MNVTYLHLFQLYPCNSLWWCGPYHRKRQSFSPSVCPLLSSAKQKILLERGHQTNIKYSFEILTWKSFLQNMDKIWVLSDFVVLTLRSVLISGLREREMHLVTSWQVGPPCLAAWAPGSDMRERGEVWVVTITRPTVKHGSLPQIVSWFSRINKTVPSC